MLDSHLERKRDTLQWYFDLGAILWELRPASVYRKHWVRQVLLDWNVPPDLGAKAMAFARKFKQAVVHELIALGIKWSTLITVLPLKSEDRLPLLKKAMKNHWSVRALRREVARRRGVPRVQERQPKSPAVSCGPCKDVHRLLNSTRDWRRYTAIWVEAVKRIQAEPALADTAKSLSTLLAVIARTEEELAQLQQEANQMHAALVRLRRRLETASRRSR